ncbi:thiocillin family RiPP [Streptomyces sp. Li-HN-5-11]|uniref:thiocillin family RiPP n=1 Tax=Streptomyces sp. Li-HN-5-11 TaxID=3075432 RepID=UPI0028AEAF37|nr:thiocillin family RiPP [Streptomyces sp. Li-HN-5-11]WNM29191.1 thiocillin family RiPP [Streptomyces sp. Li-HN-5-11]
MNEQHSDAYAVDLYALDEELFVEELPQGNALGSFSTATSAACASCPVSSASSATTASSYG